MTNATTNFADFSIAGFEDRVDLAFRKNAVLARVDEIHGEFGVVDAIRVFNDGTVVILWNDVDGDDIETVC